MTRLGYTDITVLLDRSGSMTTVAEETKTGFDRFVEEQRKLPGECRLTLIQFDTEYEPVYSGKPLAEVPPLELQPRGWTAMCDALARAVTETGRRLATMPEDERPSQVLFVVITDGLENASREFGDRAGRKRVKQMVEHQAECYRWQFVYLGANQDAVLEGGGLGVAANSAVNYASTPQGVLRTMACLSSATSRYRQAGIPQCRGSYFSQDEQQRAVDPSGSQP